MYEFPVKGAVAGYFRLADGRVETTARDRLTTAGVTAEPLVHALWEATTQPMPPTPPRRRRPSSRHITGFAQA